MGHGGTLDKGASGVLVCGVGGACKLLSKMLHGDKAYTATGVLGVATDTYDSSGQPTATVSPASITRGNVAAALARHVGETMQKPPGFSALKVGGVRMSDHMRAGREVGGGGRKDVGVG